MVVRRVLTAQELPPDLKKQVDEHRRAREAAEKTNSGKSLAQQVRGTAAPSGTNTVAVGTAARFSRCQVGEMNRHGDDSETDALLQGPCA